jgi:hypothetical protein
MANSTKTKLYKSTISLGSTVNTGFVDHIGSKTNNTYIFESSCGAKCTVKSKNSCFEYEVIRCH